MAIISGTSATQPSHPMSRLGNEQVSRIADRRAKETLREGRLIINSPTENASLHGIHSYVVLTAVKVQPGINITFSAFTCATV